MKLLIPIFMFFSFLSNPDIAEIRKIYTNAAKSEASAKEFTAKIAGVADDSDKTLWAYKGASLTLIAKFANNIPDKISNLKEGAKMIDGAAASEPNNIEIRLIRFSVQENVPKIVNYRQNKKEDKAFILAHYKEQNGALKEYVKNFILLSKSFTAAEKQTVK
ncbi:MAG TPA: hypothetical protein VK476_00885 [Flavobacterium sp.]|nr:hypothetical protein [Flavobacterium sp.]